MSRFESGISRMLDDTKHEAYIENVGPLDEDEEGDDSAEKV